MIDEDAAIAVLEDLARRCPQAVMPLAGAVFVRPGADRVMVLGGLPSPPADPAAVEPDRAGWWLSLTSWGRLEMWGDVAAAGRWVGQQGWSPG